jgi:hypothetical protein
MKHTALAVIAALSLCAATASAQDHGMRVSAVTATPQWETIKSLVGEWDGFTVKAGRKVATHVSVRMTGDGSAVMHVIDPGTPHEMVTMFYMDKDTLMATHYCAAHNQPRFEAAASPDPRKIAFAFKDGTNIRPGDAYMSRLVITVVDADHHDEDWGYDLGGKLSTATFHLTRVKAAPKG